MKSLFITCSVLCLASSVMAADTALTIYNTDLAVIRVKDRMSFTSGAQTREFTMVPERIDPTTVRFTASEGQIRIVEQNYRYDLAHSQAVLERYLDQKIAVRMRGGDMVEGILTSVAGDIVIRSDKGEVHVIRLDAIERMDLPSLPAGLIVKPTLVWTIQSDRERTTDTEVSYMTGGCSWHAEYTAVIGAGDASLELSSWVSITNNSGIGYDNARVKLVAGEVNRTQPPRPEMAGRGMKVLAAEADMNTGFEERGMFEYHLYELQGRTTVQNNENKQIALFPAATTPAKKSFIYDSRKHATEVRTVMSFMNDERGKLGMPLPAGTVRVYSRDTDGALEFVGEDAIDHTPRNEEVRLNLGAAFDLTTERTVTATRQVSDRIREETVSLEFHNRKKEAVTITAVEHFWGDWEFIRQSDTFTKKDATTAECAVSIPADSTKTVTYTVRYR